MLSKLRERTVAVLACLLVLLILPGHAQAAALILIVWGDDCPTGSHQAKPSSVITMDADSGRVKSVEHINCDGERSWGKPQTGGIVYKYQAYNTFLYRNHDPSLSVWADSSLKILLDTVCIVEVRNGYDGTLLKRLPADASYLSEYSIDKADITSVIGKPIVVDVIRPSDLSYQGTKTQHYFMD